VSSSQPLTDEEIEDSRPTSSGRPEPSNGVVNVETDANVDANAEEEGKEDEEDEDWVPRAIISLTIRREETVKLFERVLGTYVL